LTRNLPWLAELMPNMMVELSEELARKKVLKTVMMLLFQPPAVLKAVAWLPNGLSHL
jgi:hypothetical protein